MAFEDFRHECATSLSRNIRQAHKPSVPTALDEDHVTEVGVDSDEHTPLPLSALEKRPIARIGTEFACLHDVVPFPTEPVR